MFVKAWRWAKTQNFYLLATVLGVFGLVDAVTPGPVANHAIGWAIAITAIFMWAVQ